ncbi:Uncharacterised protein [Citrobacter koseri]|uniref:Uncharacterized protein n=1 Tax=Citrobacter koseri TaxID=545 RepID=A0A447UP95_CITKO|nr:Uncharacterised protein [Citrobacter koseri]
MQPVVEVKHHRNIVSGGFEFYRFDQRVQRNILKMDFGNVNDKRRAFLPGGGEQRA